MVENSVSPPFSHLPQFPELSAGPGNLFSRVLLALIVRRLGSHDPVSYSRRQAADDFNRSGDSRLGDHLRRLCREDWLKIDVRSIGSNAHMYTRGGRLIADPELCAAWDEVSVALYGPSGLLTRFRGSSAFGHGMRRWLAGVLANAQTSTRSPGKKPGGLPRVWVSASSSSNTTRPFRELS